ncbi:MAG: phosphate transport regulator [Chloroflexota bacterium]|nr:MAG: phosphate transport regulator [Chloroflexota bacterium]
MGISIPFRNKQENKFIQSLIEQCEITVEGIKLLEVCLDQPDEAALEKMRAKEYEADEIRRILIDELHNTFITPLDREDIFNLSLHIDEMIDYALTTLEEMVLLKVQAGDHLRAMVSLVRQEAEELTMAMHRLSSNPRVAGDHARQAKKLENEVDHLYRVAVADLFTKPKDFKELMAMLRRREVFRHVSNMSDRADATANVFGMVVMKLT